MQSITIRALKALANAILADYVFGDATEWEVEVLIPSILQYDDGYRGAYPLLAQHYQSLLGIRARQNSRKAEENRLIGVKDVGWGLCITCSNKYPAE